MEEFYIDRELCRKIHRFKVDEISRKPCDVLNPSKFGIELNTGQAMLMLTLQPLTNRLPAFIDLFGLNFRTPI